MKRNQLLQVSFGAYTIYCTFGDLDPALRSMSKSLEEQGDLNGPIKHSDGGMVIMMSYGDHKRDGTMVKQVTTPDLGYVSEQEYSREYR